MLLQLLKRKNLIKIKKTSLKYLEIPQLNAQNHAILQFAIAENPLNYADVNQNLYVESASKRKLIVNAVLLYNLLVKYVSI